MQGIGGEESTKLFYTTIVRIETIEGFLCDEKSLSSHYIASL